MWRGYNSDNKLHIVGTKAPNELGIYDMSGNICEWCTVGLRIYRSDTVTNPLNPIGPDSDGSRVYRGGNYFYGDTGTCRVSARGICIPNDPGLGGFRVVCLP